MGLFRTIDPKRLISDYTKEEPAPGLRGANSGMLAAIGRESYGWASTVSSLYGMKLGFSVTWLDPSLADGRAYGFLLRCLSE